MVNKEVLNDICFIKQEEGFLQGIWTDEYGREDHVADHITAILKIADKYSFTYKYNEKEWDNMDNTHRNIHLSESDFFNTNITIDNYAKADMVIGHIRSNLLEFLIKKLEA
ncbi:MAG: hypothetical protein J6A15_00605 [Clostridia bacterium]|nr:hypothetical protein [Clostridia bacterium]